MLAKPKKKKRMSLKKITFERLSDAHEFVADMVQWQNLCAGLECLVLKECSEPLYDILIQENNSKELILEIDAAHSHLAMFSWNMPKLERFRLIQLNLTDYAHAHIHQFLALNRHLKMVEIPFTNDTKRLINRDFPQLEEVDSLSKTNWMVKYGKLRPSWKKLNLQVHQKNTQNR